MCIVLLVKMKTYVRRLASKERKTEIVRDREGQTKQFHSFWLNSIKFFVYIRLSIHISICVTIKTLYASRESRTHAHIAHVLREGTTEVATSLLVNSKLTESVCWETHFFMACFLQKTYLIEYKTLLNMNLTWLKLEFD